MNDQQKQVIGRFINEVFGNPQGQVNVLALVDFLLKTKAAQKTQIIDWVNTKKANNTALKDGLPAQKLQVESALDADNALLQSTSDSL